MKKGKGLFLLCGYRPKMGDVKSVGIGRRTRQCRVPTGINQSGVYFINLQSAVFIPKPKKKNFSENSAILDSRFGELLVESSGRNSGLTLA